MSELDTHKFYECSIEERKARLEEAGYDNNTLNILMSQYLLSPEIGDHLVENYIGDFDIPMGLGLNFVINKKDYVIPMATEEPSVIAAASNAAKMAKKGGGFKTKMEHKYATGQVVLTNIPDLVTAIQTLESRREEIIEKTNQYHPSIVERGGGVKNIQVLTKNSSNHEFLTVLFFIDTKEAMGANIVNTMMEGITPILEEWTGGEKLLAILSNLPTEAVASASTCIPYSALGKTEEEGIQLAERIVLATEYANIDPYRAVTHNKGIMNGVHAVAVATGNDTRALEAAVHAYAARSGHYQTLSYWHLSDDGLCGEITLPLALGTVGGAVRVLPKAKANLSLLNHPSSRKLAQIMAAVGLAQNLAALKALVSEGIQRGHMSLHANSLAIHAGAIGSEIEKVATYLKKNQCLNSTAAKEYLAKIRK